MIVVNETIEPLKNFLDTRLSIDQAIVDFTEKFTWLTTREKRIWSNFIKISQNVTALQ